MNAADLPATWTGYAIAHAVGRAPWPVVRRLEQLGAPRPGKGGRYALDDRWPLAVAIANGFGEVPRGGAGGDDVAVLCARHFLADPGPYICTDGHRYWTKRRPIDVVRSSRSYPAGLTVVKVNRLAPWAGPVLARILAAQEAAA